MSTRLHFVAAVLLTVSPACGAEQFRLVVPGNSEIESTALLRGGRLAIETNGRTYVYTAHPRYDSADGSYRAYYSPEARQYVRWPVRGEGSMYIGQPSGATVAWRRSQMQIVPLRGAVDRPDAPPVGQPHTVRRPDVTSRAREFERFDPRDRSIPSVARHEASPHLAVLRDVDGGLTSAIIDDQGTLQFFAGQGERRYRPERVPTGLVPRAPLVLAESPGPAHPTVYTISRGGSLMTVVDGRIRELAGDLGAPSFVPGTHLARTRRGRHTILFAVDRLGRVWEFDTGRLRFQAIESRAGFFQPGSPITAMRASEERVYLVDLQGNLIEYHLRVDGWSRPTFVADGFPPSSPVAARFIPIHAAPGAYLAAVNSRGQVRVLHETRSGWTSDVVDAARLPPLSPVAVAEVGGRLSVCGVDVAGRWIQWRRGHGVWRERTICTGLPTGTPVVLDSDPTVALALDHSRRLIAGRLLDDRWQCRVHTPTVDLAPQLISRRVIANPPLEPVTVNLANSHTEPLIVHAYDAKDPGSPREVKVAPGGSVPFRIERDAGAILEEVYLDYDRSGQPRERVQRLPIPPRSLYAIVVSAERVTSVYFDRTRNKTSVPDKVSTSEVSLGTFRLPAGAALQQGHEIDLARNAQSQRNPGARSLIEATSRPR